MPGIEHTHGDAAFGAEYVIGTLRIPANLPARCWAFAPHAFMSASSIDWRRRVEELRAHGSLRRTSLSIDR